MSSKRQPAIGLMIVVLFLVPVFLNSDYWLHVLTIVGINVILAASLQTISRTGELTLGTAGFMALGAYTSALLALRLGLSVWIAMLVGGLICAMIAVALGYPFMRAKGIYFSILTLVTGEVFRLTAWHYRSLTGGPVGLSRIPPPNPIIIPGVATITFDSKTSYYYLILAVTLLSLLILFRLQNSQVGLVWKAIREKDDLAASVGINVLRYKIFAFATGCFFTGIAGALFAHFMHILAADDTGKFGLVTSIYVLIYVVVGGEASLAGPVVGAFLLTMLPEVARPLKEYQPIVFGAMVIFVVFFVPQGIIALPRRVELWWKRLTARGDELELPKYRSRWSRQ